MRKFLLLPLSAVALAVLAACGGRQPAPVVVVPPAPVVNAPPANPGPPIAAPIASIRAGFGRIESMTPVQTASAGGTAPTSMQRLGIRMDDGTMQVVDTASPGLSIGDRVELTREGFIRRHPS